MHVYIYDLYLNQKKYNNILSKIETRITDLGLNGKIIRLTETSSLFSIIENETKKNIKTLTVVGNNNILNNTINSILKIYSNKQTLSTNMPIGFIPIGKENNNLSAHLGIDFDIKACDILASRRVEKIDLGKINNLYFLFEAKIEALGTFIEVDNLYSLEINTKGSVDIINLPITSQSSKDMNYSKDAGFFELLISTKKNSLNKNSVSKIKFQCLKLHNPNHQLLVDNSLKISTPVNIEVAKEKIYLIVGKKRTF